MSKRFNIHEWRRSIKESDREIINEDGSAAFWNVWNYIHTKELKEEQAITYLYDSIRKGKIDLKTFAEILYDTAGINSQFKDLKKS